MNDDAKSTNIYWDLHKEILIWLQNNRQLAIDEKISEIKKILFSANLDDLTLAHYAANGFIAFDNCLEVTNQMPISLMQAHKVGHDNYATRQAIINSNKSHSETNEFKCLIIADYKENKSNFSSKDKAAIHYTKQYPLQFQTIRNYLKNI